MLRWRRGPLKADRAEGERPGYIQVGPVPLCLFFFFFRCYTYFQIVALRPMSSLRSPMRVKFTRVTSAQTQHPLLALKGGRLDCYARTKVAPVGNFVPQPSHHPLR